MLVFVKGEKPEYPGKTLGARTRTNNKLSPHMTPGPGIEPGQHWWEASALTIAIPSSPGLHFNVDSDLDTEESLQWAEFTSKQR